MGLIRKSIRSVLQVNLHLGETLFISNSAVEKHINSIFAKLGLSPGESETHRGVAAVLAFLGNHDVPVDDDRNT